MNMQMTRWRPDSCGCVLVYSWDADVPEAERVHTPATVEKACERHDHEDVEVVHLAAGSENVLKNHVFEELRSDVPDLDPREFVYEFVDGELRYQLPADRRAKLGTRERLSQELGAREKA